MMLRLRRVRARVLRSALVIRLESKKPSEPCKAFPETSRKDTSDGINRCKQEIRWRQPVVSTIARIARSMETSSAETGAADDAAFDTT